MKISLLISAIILGIAAFFVISRQNEIKLLTSAWTELESRALVHNVPTDPKASFSTERIRAERTRVARAEKIADFSAELTDSHQKLIALQQSEVNQREYQSESAAIQAKIVELSSDDLLLLINVISANSSLEGRSRSALVNWVTWMLASKNPEAALAITMETWESLNTKGGGNGPRIHSILRQYAARDPVAAAQWLADHKDQIGKIEENGKKDLIREVAKKDLGAALNFIDILEPKKDSNIYFTLASSVTSENADVFLAAIRERVEDSQRESAFNGLVNSDLMMNFETGATWIEESDFIGAERKDLFACLDDFAYRDQPGKWLNWIADQEEVEGFSPSDTSASIIQRWTMDNFPSAGEWINSQEEGARKNLAIQTYAETLAPYEPAAAAEWAATLPEGSERTRVFERIHRSLAKVDPAAAAVFAADHGIVSGN